MTVINERACFFNSWLKGQLKVTEAGVVLSLTCVYYVRYGETRKIPMLVEEFL